ncbi:MAG TPA: hypothetical protein VGU20_19470 [Stellaceae bacterium]|nr:hypothetical protein [Stellaceae bacterium]
MALLTNRAYPDTASLQCGSFIPNLFRVGSCTDLHTFWLTLAALLTLLYVLLLWVLSRSARARQDHNGRLRGGVVTAVLVSAVLLGFTLLTDVARPDGDADRCGGFVARFFGFKHCVEIHPFWLAPGTFLAFGYLPLVWILWRMARAGRSPGVDNDVGSPLLKAATWVFWACIAFAILDVQPRLIAALDQLYARPPTATISAGSLKGVLAGATAFISAVAAFSGKIGQFLKVSEHATRRSVLVARVASQALVWLAAVLLPLLLFVLYLHLAAWGMDDLQGAKRPFDSIPQIYPWALAATVLVGVFFKPNSYSLHQLYRDRLSKAFLFDPRDPDGRPADAFKLSQIDVLQGPYHLINAAMNVQGSLAANQRGREADFFTFSRDFVGSDLTLYARTNSRAAVPAAAGHRGAGPSAEPRPWVRRLADAVRHVFHGFFERKGRYADMEGADPALSVATAMAISGAAFSANMGSNTVRPLSPTLALLNVRLGYWLRNPRELAKPRQITVRRLIDAAHLVFGKLYLLLEMLNMLDEKSRNIYLSDGGHIENLGVYELLKRGCQLIIAVDAECDPALAFPSLVKMERYARIDLGVRIDLPWEEITAASRRYDRELADGTLSCPWNNGPHCAFGHILYHDGSEGVLFYVKSAVTGDETDYVLDYKRRYPAFPHETTGDQFFSEEQFEAYRALGFHAVDRALAGSDQIALSDELRARGITPEMMLDWVRGMLCCI